MKNHLKNIFQTTLTVVLAVFIIAAIVKAGSLTPSASPNSTMNSLSEIAGSGFATATHSLKALYDWLGTNVSTPLKGSYDASAQTASLNGNTMQVIRYMAQHMPGTYTYGSNDASNVLTTASGTYNATLLTAGNVRSGVSFGVGSTGTYGGADWTYGSDDAAKVLTTADVPGTYNATNLSVGTVKSGTSFAVSSTGAYPSATYPLPGACDKTDLAASGGNISSSNGIVEWWQSDGTRQAAILDFPDVSNLCDSDTANNSTGTLTIDASKVVSGTTYCGVAGTDAVGYTYGDSQASYVLITATGPGTALYHLFNGSGSGKPGGSQTQGGVEDYNSGSAPTDRYACPAGWTQCTAGNSYCGTSLSSANYKDNCTGLIWSQACDGTGCASFTTNPNQQYTWDNSGVKNNSQTAAELCSSGSHGESGWSLPHEKQFIQAYVDGSFGNLDATINLFSWSATSVSNATSTSAWKAELSTGQISSADKNGNGFVRCVR